MNVREIGAGLNTSFKIKSNIRLQKVTSLGKQTRLVFARLKMNKEEMKALGAVRSVRSHKTPILSEILCFWLLQCTCSVFMGSCNKHG